MNKIKLYVDDERQAPNGWVNVKSAEMAIKLLKEGRVEELSLDHDLGRKKTGYDIVLWMERAVMEGSFELPNKIIIHTANPVGRQKMAAAINTMLKRMEN